MVTSVMEIMKLFTELRTANMETGFRQLQWAGER